MPLTMSSNPNYLPFTVETGSFSLNSNDDTGWIDTKGLVRGSFQLAWENHNGTISTAIMEGTNDTFLLPGEFGANLGGAVLDTETDSQIWEFKEFTVRYIRLAYTSNDATLGDASWVFWGYRA